MKKGLVVNISDIELNFYVNDFQWRMGDTQLISAGQVTPRGTNRKHSSSKELSFIAAQPVMRFNHSLDTPRREMTLKLSPLASQSLFRLPGCCCFQCQIEKTGALVKFSLIKVLFFSRRHEHLTCFILSVSDFPALVNLCEAITCSFVRANQPRRSLSKIPVTSIKRLLSSISP